MSPQHCSYRKKLQLLLGNDLDGSLILHIYRCSHYVIILFIVNIYCKYCKYYSKPETIILKLLFQSLLEVLRNELMFIFGIFIMSSLSLWLYTHKNVNPLLMRILQACILQAASKWKVKQTQSLGIAIAQYLTIKIWHKHTNIRKSITDSKTV